MFDLLYYTYYYKYKEERKQIRLLVENDDGSNISGAQVRIDTVITEHDNYINNNNIENTGNTFTSVDNLSLHHAFDHLPFASEFTIQKQSVINALNEG